MWPSERRASAIVFGLIDPNLKPLLASWLIVGAFGAFAFAGYAGLRDTRNYSVEIQQSRELFFLVTCKDTNMRHAKAIQELESAIAALPAGVLRLRAVRERPLRVALIDAIVPVRDCAEYVKLARLAP